MLGPFEINQIIHQLPDTKMLDNLKIIKKQKRIIS
jgi:hypothetical protein